MEETQPKTKQGRDVQKSRNKLLRILDMKRMSNRMPVKTMLDNQKVMSVNQIAVQIKMLEVQKAKNTEEDPLKIKFKTTVGDGRSTRGDQSGKAVEVGRTRNTRAFFIWAATRTWNRALDEIKMANTIYSAKQRMKTLC